MFRLQVLLAIWGTISVVADSDTTTEVLPDEPSPSEIPSPEGIPPPPPPPAKNNNVPPESESSGDDELPEVATTPRPRDINKPTDIPQSDIDDALFLEYGEYSTISFQYYNDRYLGWHKDEPVGYTCHDDYIRCLLSQTLRHPVCVVHKYNWNEEGIRNLPTICDLYHYNCRRGFRYYFFLKYGSCSFRNIYHGNLIFFSPIYNYG